jgi:hypothetical protein
LQLKNGLQGECALADAWFAAKENKASGYKPSAKHSVQFTIAHIYAWL